MASENTNHPRRTVQPVSRPFPVGKILRSIFILAVVLFLLPLSPAHAKNPDYARTVRVGIYENNPKVFVDASLTPKGIFVDILDEIARSENWKIDYLYGTWAENIQRLGNGQIDLMVDVSFSAERAEQFAFNRTPVLESWLDVYSKREVRISSIRDLNMKKIAVLEGSVQEKYLLEVIKPTLGIDFTLLPYPDYPAGIKAVKSGIADVMVASRFFSFSSQRDANIVPANVIFRSEGLHFAFPKNIDAGLVETIDRHIVAMKNNLNSAYYLSLKRWLDIRPPALVPNYIKYALAVITGLLIIIGLFALLLRRQVALKISAIREAYQLLDETQTIAGMGGWEYDPNARHMKWTNQVYRIYGVGLDYDPGDAYRNISSYAPHHAPIIEKAFRLAVEEGRPYDLKLELIRGDGRHIWVWTTSRPVVKNGKVIRVNGNIMDITAAKHAEAERNKLQEQLFQVQKMDLVGRLAGGVAHDFNNMLGVIIGNAETALSKTGPEQELHSDLEEILKAAHHSAGLTRQLLTFARKQVVEPRIIDLNEKISGTLKMLKSLIREDIDLKWQPEPSLWPVKVDPLQIDQIMANLCVNARDAITGTGKIIIETANSVFDENYCANNANYMPGEYAMIAVSDTGCGMYKETLGHLFEPFFTTKGIGKGTGLGLAMVYGIVRQNNGFINVYSEPRQGSTFKIYLPRHRGPVDQSHAKSAAEIPRGQGQTILLVEDEDSLRKLFTELLKKLGYAVLTASSPREAIRLAQEHDGGIHLILTDVILPDMNGRDLAGRVKETRPAIKCLFMSGYTADVIAHRGMLFEEVNFIQKPFSQKNLALKVKEALEK
ncbi:MAG: transporter substrate-binding domain-containing protein [Candidatus Brocadiia bacterium]